MSKEPEETDEREVGWFRERMRELRRQRETSAPSFGQTWRAVRAREAAEENALVLPWGRFAVASAVAIAVAIFVVFYTASDRPHRWQQERDFANRERDLTKLERQLERDFAKLDGLLITYWEAPSDELFSLGSPAETPTRDE